MVYGHLAKYITETCFVTTSVLFPKFYVQEKNSSPMFQESPGLKPSWDVFKKKSATTFSLQQFNFEKTQDIWFLL